jgi:hypothetical protein
MSDTTDVKDASSAAGPSRVVDQSGQGWYLASDGDGGTKWQASYGWQRDLPDMPSLGALVTARGPLRPVLPVTEADTDAIDAELRRAGRKAVTTLAAALHGAYNGIRGKLADRDGQAAQRLLMAGREGSWESESMMSFTWFGSGIKAGRIDPGARDAVAAIITRWVTGPDRYTEVAENLAGVVSAYADTEHGADGWKRIADQWLQPGSVARADFAAAYRWLYSQSQYFDHGMT